MITLAEKLLLVSGSKANPESYVEFVSSTAMTITPKYTNSGVTLQYSLNGSTWTTITSGASTPSDNIIYFRGRATGTKTLFTSSAALNAWTFAGATNLEVYGKLDRLIQNALGGDEDILSIGNYCYAYMFYGCTSLTTAPELPATSLASYCYIGMFRGCTSLTTAPELPATSLANFCCNSMFLGCTSLTTPPALPATTIASFCYYVMFNGCTNLKLSTTMTGIYDTAYRIPTTGTGTMAGDAMYNMFALTGGTFTGTPTINTTYYTENIPV